MAYQTTGLTKGLIALAVILAAGSAAWHFALKDRFGKGVDVTQAEKQAQPKSDGKGVGTGAATQPVAASGKGALGSSGNPLKVSLVSFHGYAPAMLANGGSLKTASGSIFQRLGVNVEFVLNDDIPTMETLFESRAAHCVWRTSDYWAQEQPNLRNANHDGRAIVIVDNTQGADAVITRDPKVKSIEDLVGKSTGLLQFTPSHGMFMDAVENSSLTAKQRKLVESKTVFVKAEEGTAGVRSMFVAGQVDAAVLWDPDLSLALKAVPGAKVIYSTQTASNLIYDIVVCDQRELVKPENTAAFQQFVDGWLEGVAVAKKNPEQAIDALVSSMPFYKELANKEGRPFVKGLFQNLVWTDLSDNARVLGLAGGVDHYSRVYSRFDAIYRAAGALANPKSPVIAPQDSFDMRFVKTALARDAAATEAAAKPQVSFTDQGRAAAMAAPAKVTKPVSVNFASGSAELSKRAQQVIDKEMVPFIENNGTGYFELGGNTDAIGSPAANVALSLARANAVAEYLVKQWEVPKSRLKVTGYGSARPLCDEANPQASDLSIEECRALNRSTRLAVFSK